MSFAEEFQIVYVATATPRKLERSPLPECGLFSDLPRRAAQMGAGGGEKYHQHGESGHMPPRPGSGCTSTVINRADSLPPRDEVVSTAF